MSVKKEDFVMPSQLPKKQPTMFGHKSPPPLSDEQEGANLHHLNNQLSPKSRFTYNANEIVMEEEEFSMISY